MNDREISELKLDMLFRIFGISIVDHEEVIFCDHPISGRRIIPSMQKDIQIGILEEKEPWYIRGRYDSYDVLREAVRILEHVDNYETFTISSERWPILTQRRPFARTLERRANEFLMQCRYLPDFAGFEIDEFKTFEVCEHRIRIFMKNGKFVQYVMNGDNLGRGYYQRLVFVLLNLFEEVLEIQEEIDKERQKNNDIELSRIQMNSFYGLGADFDGDALVIMQRGRGLSKSLLQIEETKKLLKNGVSKIQIAPGNKLEKLHNDILDSYRYLYGFDFIKDCTATAIVRYCEADVNATVEAALKMKENNKQVVLEQLEEVDPQVPIKQFESLVTGSPNGEPEILIDVNKEGKTMMIPVVRRPEIKEVIFNEPATIVFWKDGTKTVVKCGKGEKFDPEKGVAIALAKKMLYSKDYSRVIASSDDWKKAKEAKKAAAKKTTAKKAPAKKKPMPKLPVNANVTKTSTVKKTTRKGAK